MRALIKNTVIAGSLVLISSSGSAQQAPVITIHSDDKPPYVSPFDKTPQTTADSSLSSQGRQKLVNVQIGKNNVAQKSTMPIDNGPKYSSTTATNLESDEKPAIKFKKTTKFLSPKLNIQRAERIITAHNALTAAEPQGSQKDDMPTKKDIAKSSLQPAESGATATELKPIEVQALTQSNDIVVSPKLNQQPEATSFREVDSQVQVSSTKETQTNNKNMTTWLWIVGLLSALSAAALRLHFLNKDPALTDPWFKPSK